ncbi:MAG TPA: sulfotransferase [Thermodesulfobacteriota bacterium]|nr:sulfotransferase [Thermodesulfobacteriota bacterium]
MNPEHNTKRQAKVLVIAGHVRSGTTLLRNICDSHPHISVTNELKYFKGLGNPFTSHCRVLLGRLWGKAMTGDSYSIQIANYKFACRYLLNLLRYKRGPVISAPAIGKSLSGAFPGARVVGDKTPEYIFSLDRFASAEGFSCLVIFRDARDVTSSTLQRVRTRWRSQGWTADFDTAEKVALKWMESIEIMERNREKIHIIRYEDLVTRPAPELERLGLWLGVDPGLFPESAVSEITDAGIGKYRSGLTEEELSAVTEITGPKMESLGYRL